MTLGPFISACQTQAEDGGNCSAGCAPQAAVVHLEPAIYFKREMRAEFVSGGRVVESRVFQPSAQPENLLRVEGSHNDLTIRWYVDENLWFEQPVDLSRKRHIICGQTCVSYEGALAFPESLPDGTPVGALVPDCAAVACQDKVIVELVSPIPLEDAHSVYVDSSECGASCATAGCTLGAQPSDVDACEPPQGTHLEALTYWGRADELVVRGFKEVDEAELSFTQALPVEPLDPHVPSAPPTACSPGCFVGRAVLAWPDALRGEDPTPGAAGAPGAR